MTEGDLFKIIPDWSHLLYRFSLCSQNLLTWVDPECSFLIVILISAKTLSFLLSVFPGHTSLQSLTPIPILSFSSAAFHPSLYTIVFCHHAPCDPSPLSHLQPLLCFLPSSAQWRRNLFIMRASALSTYTIKRHYSKLLKLQENDFRMMCMYSAFCSANTC